MNTKLYCRFFFVFALSANFVFSSCEETDASIKSVSSSCVFSYQDEQSMPKMWLSVYVQTEDDVRRLENIIVTNRNSGYKWMIKNPVFIANGNRKWAGFSKILPAQGDSLSIGLYDIKITDATGEEDSGSFMISYSADLLTSPSSEIKKIVKGNISENLVLYDSNGTIIYYGKRKNLWKTDENILKDYAKTETKRLCLSSAGGNLLFLLPAEKLEAEKK